MRQEPWEFGKKVDVVIIYFHTAIAKNFEQYATKMDALRRDFPKVRFIYTTGGFMAGVFLQCGTLLMHAVMFRSSRFLKATAVAGMLANGLDLLHVLVGGVAPRVAEALSAALALYLVWYPLLAFDLFKLARSSRRE